MRQLGGNFKQKNFIITIFFLILLNTILQIKKYINAADIAFNMFNFSGLIYIQSFNFFHDFY